jgi:hypothetical protein
VHPLVATYLRRDGATEAEIAEAIGVPTATIRRWRSVYPVFDEAVKVSPLATLELVVRALFKSAVGQEFVDVERMYEMRVHPVTRERERVLVREKEIRRRALPNPIACFFYLQNRDATRWQPAGARGNASPFTPEQISVMMRAGSQAVSDLTLGQEWSKTG